MPAEKLGVLVRGAGWVAGEHISAYLNNPYTEIRVVDARFDHEIEAQFARHAFRCDKSLDKYEEQLQRDDIHVVSICTISHLHAAEAIAAARAGKHVMVEKPAALSLQEMKRLRDVVNESGVKSAVGFVVRWYPTVVSIKAQIDKGALGDIYYAGSGYWHQVFGDWKGKRSLGGSSLLMGGCHSVDLVRWLSGKEAAEVRAYATGPHNRSDFEYPPTVDASLLFTDGTIGRISSALECNMPYVFSIELVGTRGAVRDNLLYSMDFPGALEFVKIPGTAPDSPDVTHHPFDMEINAFVDCIRQNRPMATDINDAYKTHEIIFAVEESIRTHKPVPLPL
ncbi:MAG: Gfo/Idh/MocA family oxidoreductase [Planctomycetes bacterium]|nr:Gfo/Idh/MocA family oxidoreductase [Planctomycetota bacterium]